MSEYFAPEIDCIIEKLNRDVRDGKPTNMTDTMHAAIDRLFEALSPIEISGDDELRSCWITVERGPESAYLDQWYDPEYVDVSKEELLKDRLRSYPDEMCWYNIFCRDYRGHRSVGLAHELIIYQAPERQECDYGWDLAEFIDFLSQRVSVSVKMMKNGTYNAFVQNNLPLRYREGTILSKRLWE